MMKLMMDERIENGGTQSLRRTGTERGRTRFGVAGDGAGPKQKQYK